MTAPRDKDVRRLDVAMDDAFTVSGVQRVGNLGRQIEKQSDSMGVPRDLMLQGHAIEKLHGDEGASLVIADLVNRADVGVVQRRSCARLAAKAFQGLRVLCDLVRQELERDEAAKIGIFGFEHHAHPAAAELTDDAVMRDRSSDHVM